MPKAAKRAQQKLRTEAIQEARHKHDKSLHRRRALRIALFTFGGLVIVNAVYVGLANRRPPRPRVIQGPQTFDGATCTDTAPTPWDQRPSFGTPPARVTDNEKKYTAVIDTNCGKIEVALDNANAPKTVNSFVFLADRHSFFDGLTWHRVVDGFVIQGGDPEGTGNGGPGYTVDDELPKEEQCPREEGSERLQCYPRGTLAMANSGPDTNGSQFFIVTGDNIALDPNYSVFGKVTKGMAVADKLESFAQPDQTPSRPLYIYRLRIKDE